ncbi:MAG: nucleotidyl transferase AbiEii/AbiGii toxin family protein [Candidatus Paceibacterota bacterium]|jgi:predicted nucleotidyltransferase component of viral defense system
MDAVAVMPVSERRDLFTETAEQVGFDLPAIAEKDFWVCWTLKRIFSLPPPYSKLIFKGGTTLSKVYRIIRRFSEKSKSYDFSDNPN